MPGSAVAEVYFIAAMMILILIICAVAVFAFIVSVALTKSPLGFFGD